MKLDPNAKKENDFPVLPAGEYEFEVENTKYQKSAAGNLQWVVELRIDPTDGNQSIKVWDYFPERENMQWKYNSFFKAIGKEGVTDTDEMKNVVREIGFCKLGIEPAKDGYSEKNKVERYVTSPATEPAKKAAPKGLDIDPDDLPF